MGLVDLAYPKTGVDVAIVIDNRAVGLTADGVPIDPQGVQGIGVERLDRAVRQAHENHAVGVGGRVDGEAGVVIHGLINENFAGDSIHLVNAGAGVGVDGTVHQNGAAAGVHIVAGSNGGSPVQLGILGVDRRLVVHHTVILIVLA